MFLSSYFIVHFSAFQGITKAKTAVGVDLQYSEDFDMNVGLQRGSVISVFYLQLWLMLRLYMRFCMLMISS